MVVAFLAAVALTAQSPEPKAVVIEVRSTDPDQILTVNVEAFNGAAFGLAVWNGAPGRVFQSGNKGDGTTPLLVNVSPNPGRIRISVPANSPALRAFVHGDTAKNLIAHAIEIVRDTTGAVTLKRP